MGLLAQHVLAHRHTALQVYAGSATCGNVTGSGYGFFCGAAYELNPDSLNVSIALVNNATEAAETCCVPMVGEQGLHACHMAHEGGLVTDQC